MSGILGQSVEFGLGLAKRVRVGKDEAVTAPKLLSAMDRSLCLSTTTTTTSSYDTPTCPMVYAMISDPTVVDNPEIPSYQPYVHGRCNPPALIPLHMDDISLDLDCLLHSCFVTLRGSWRLHCVTACRRSDCLFLLPMAHQGSVLGVEIEVAGSTYSTQIVPKEEAHNMAKLAKDEYGCSLRPRLFSLTIPHVYGGSIISISVRWFQQLLYIDGNFSLDVPFTFPDYVMPFKKRSSTREKIHLNVNTGIGTEVICKTISHPLKEFQRQVGKLSFMYEEDIVRWSCVDFSFSYMVSSDEMFGGLLLQSPSMYDIDQREMCCLYLFPGNKQDRKVFSKEVVFLVDVSGSMRGKTIDNVKNALKACLSKLSPSDSFNIIAFNEEIKSLSSSLELATMGTINHATQWIDEHCFPGGGTNLLVPLSEAMKMLSNCHKSNPHIFLITDGADEDERNICNKMKTLIASGGSMSPRISTFGMGTCCNHYFLRMLSHIGRGHYDAAYKSDCIDSGIQRLFVRASSAALRNIFIDSTNQLDFFEVYPHPIPDLSSECPLLLLGRYRGKFPESVKLRGISAQGTDVVMDLDVGTIKDIPLEKVFAKREMDVITTQAWYSDNKQLEQQVTKMSIKTGFTSEYTRMVFLQSEERKQPELMQRAENTHLATIKKTLSWINGSSDSPKIVLLHTLNCGFGDVNATRENTPSILDEKLVEVNEVLNKVTSCCNRIDCCCCVYFISVCSKVGNGCTTGTSQLCAALSCIGCLRFCMEVCDECDC